MASRQHRLLHAALAVAAAVYLLAAGLGWLPATGTSAPGWVLMVAGSTFALAAVIMLLPPASIHADAIAATILMAFSWIGFYVAVAQPFDGLRNSNTLSLFGATLGVAQLLVGLGSVLCLLMSLWAIRRWQRRSQ